MPEFARCQDGWAHVRCLACESCACPHVWEALAAGVMPTDLPIVGRPRWLTAPRQGGVRTLAVPRGDMPDWIGGRHIVMDGESYRIVSVTEPSPSAPDLLLLDVVPEFR